MSCEKVEARKHDVMLACWLWLVEVATTSDTRLGRRFEQWGVVMKLVMNMVRMLFKAGEVIFDFGEKSDDR